MKKIYTKPAVEAIMLEHTAHLLAGSETFKVNNNADPVDPEDTW